MIIQRPLISFIPSPSSSSLMNYAYRTSWSSFPPSRNPLSLSLSHSRKFASPWNRKWSSNKSCSPEYHSSIDIILDDIASLYLAFGTTYKPIFIYQSLSEKLLLFKYYFFCASSSSCQFLSFQGRSIKKSKTTKSTTTCTISHRNFLEAIVIYD